MGLRQATADAYALAFALDSVATKAIRAKTLLDAVKVSPGIPTGTSGGVPLTPTGGIPFRGDVDGRGIVLDAFGNIARAAPATVSSGGGPGSGAGLGNTVAPGTPVGSSAGAGNSRAGGNAGSQIPFANNANTGPATGGSPVLNIGGKALDALGSIDRTLRDMARSSRANAGVSLRQQNLI